MYRNCDVCTNNQLEIDEDSSMQTEVAWFQWKTIQEERSVKQKGGQAQLWQVTLTVKEEQKGSLSDIDEQFYHQLSETMSDNETLIHVDFAEKYIGKLSNSVQSAHF